MATPRPDRSSDRVTDSTATPPAQPSPLSWAQRALLINPLRIYPVAGELTSGFGYRRDPFGRKHRSRRPHHNGLDYGAHRGTPVFSAGPGVVVRARRWGQYGRIVVVDHRNGYETRYAHLHRISVRKGDRVAAGDNIGSVGSTGRTTGPHLHFELRLDGRALDPRPYLSAAESAEAQPSALGNRQ